MQGEDVEVVVVAEAAEARTFSTILTWRAGCGESRTSGSGRGDWKRIFFAGCTCKEEGALVIYFTPLKGQPFPGFESLTLRQRKASEFNVQKLFSFQVVV